MRVTKNTSNVFNIALSNLRLSDSTPKKLRNLM